MNPSDFLTLMRMTIPHGVFTNRQLALLGLCAEAGDFLDFTSTAYNLRVSKPALSRGIDALEYKGFLQRQKKAFSVDGKKLDFRKTFIAITPQGTAFLQSLGVA